MCPGVHDARVPLATASLVENIFTARCQQSRRLIILARASQQANVMSYFSQHNDDNGDDAEDLSGPEPTGRDCLVRAVLNEARHGLQRDRSARAITVTVGRHLNSGTLDVVLPADASYYDPRSLTTVTVSDASRHAPAAADSATVAAQLAAAYGDAPRVEL